MIRAVVFDLDDTLYDYKKCNEIAEKYLFEMIETNFGVESTKVVDLLYDAKKQVKERLGENVAAAHNRLLYMQNICEQLGKNPLKYATIFYNAYWDTVLEEMECFEYVKPLFDSLQSRNIKIGVLTDLTSYIQYRKLNHLGLSDYVDFIVTSEEVGEEKPSEKMFNLVLKKMNVRADETIMVGDDFKKDIVGAEVLGIHTIHYFKGLDVKKEIFNYFDEN